jgi:hypothetical protein
MSQIKFCQLRLTACLLLLAAGLSVNSQAQATCSALTTAYEARYYGSYKGWRIDTTQKMEQRLPDVWRLSIYADNVLGSILEKSSFKVSPAGKIVSQEYSYEKKILVNKSNLTTLFDWVKKRANTAGNKTGSVILKGGEFDNLNYQLALRCDLIAGKTEFIYPVVDRNEIDNLEFKIMGEEMLDTKLGKVNTVIVKRVRNNNNRITTLWFAKDKDYVMVKLLQEERKDTEAYLLYIDSLVKK